MEKYDLIVAGGGLTGVAAAVSAAREGLKVLLVEKSGALGGAINNNLVYPFMPFWTKDLETGGRKYLSAGIFTEMRERQDKYVEPSIDEMEFRPEYFKLVLDEMVTEAGVDVLFHSSVFDAVTEGETVKSVKVVALSGVLEFESDFFIDATGNGDLFALAGCEFQLGRESDSLCQPMTTCFRMSGVNTERFTKEKPEIQVLYRKFKAEGKIENPREDILTFLGIGEGILHFNTTRIIKLDPTNAFDVSKAEIEARKQIFEMVAFLKEHSMAFANATIISIASEIGVRESRKLKGVHILTAEELKDLTDFEDSIALGNYDIDIHNPSGSGTSHYYFTEGDYYKIPYSCLLPKEFNNLIAAGRCISATHEAQASIRIMPICACLGQAAGTAAAVACKTGSNAKSVDIKAVQAKLKENGAAL
jgi:hypothetical protein